MSGSRGGRASALIGNTVVFALGSLAVKVVSLALMPLYTSALTASQYGVAELLNSGIEIALPLLSLGVIEALYRFAIDDDVDKRALFTGSLLLLGGAVAVAAALSALAHLLWHYEHAGAFLALFTTTSLYKGTTQLARGLGHVRRFVAYGLLNALVLVLASYALLRGAGAGVEGYLWSYSIGYLSAGAVAFLVSREYRLLVPFRPDGALMRRMLAYSLPLVPNLLSWWIVSVSGRYVVLWGSGLAAAGLFSAAGKMPSLINIITSVFQQAWQYTTAREIGSAGSGAFFGRVLRGYALLTLSMAGAVIAMNRVFSRILLQAEFQEAWRYVPLLMLAATFGIMSTFFGTFYQALLDSRMLMVSTMLGAVVNLLLGMILVVVMGPWGAGVAAALSYLIVLIVRARGIASRIDMPIHYGRISYQLALLSLMAVCTSVDGRPWLGAMVWVCLALLLASDPGALRLVAARARAAVRGR